MSNCGKCGNSGHNARRCPLNTGLVVAGNSGMVVSHAQTGGAGHTLSVVQTPEERAIYLFEKWGHLSFSTGVEIKVRNILEVAVPARLINKQRTGHDKFDEIMGGQFDPGINSGRVVLWTGVSGGGKSTLFQEVANAITGAAKLRKKFTGGRAIINFTEQGADDVAKRISTMNLQHGFIPMNHTNVYELIEAMEEYVVKVPEGMKVNDYVPQHETYLFVDSLFGMFVPKPPGQRGRVKGDHAMQEEVVKILTAWAKANAVILIILGHVNKSGKAAGKNTIIHLVDAHIHMQRVKFKVEGMEFSYLCVVAIKNRGGQTEKEYKYEIKREGILWLDEAEATVGELTDGEEEEGDDEDGDNGGTFAVSGAVKPKELAPPVRKAAEKASKERVNPEQGALKLG